MILLYFALSLLSVLRLSECTLFFHQDCDLCMLPIRNDLLNRHMTDHHADRPWLNVKFEKTQARLRALGQEMNLLSNVRTANVQGNTGLQNAASLLFDPLIDFYTVFTSASSVAASIVAVWRWGEWPSAVSNQDTVRLLQDLLYGPTLH